MEMVDVGKKLLYQKKLSMIPCGEDINMMMMNAVIKLLQI